MAKARSGADQAPNNDDINKSNSSESEIRNKGNTFMNRNRDRNYKKKTKSTNNVCSQLY